MKVQKDISLVCFIHHCCQSTCHSRYLINVWKIKGRKEGRGKGRRGESEEKSEEERVRKEGKERVRERPEREKEGEETGSPNLTTNSYKMGNKEEF